MLIFPTELAVIIPVIRMQILIVLIAYFATALYICWGKIAEAALLILKKGIRIAAVAFAPILRTASS